MIYILFVVLIIIASVLIIFAVLAQNPKGGMAANFGVSNQVMGARQTSDFLEKFTWYLAVAVVILSLLASITMSSHVNRTGSGDRIIDEVTLDRGVPASTPASAPAEIPTVPAETGTETVTE